MARLESGGLTPAEQRRLDESRRSSERTEQRNRREVVQRAPSPGTFSGGFSAMPATSMAPELAVFMAAIRKLESGSVAGNYNAVGRWVKGDRALGAYQIMSKNWRPWAAAAGIPGADWRNPQAQDRVAGYMMQRYYNEYRDWDLVAVAWFGGRGPANRAAQRGYSGNPTSLSYHFRRYVTKLRGFYGEAQQYAGSGASPTQQYYATTYSSAGGSGYVFPVPGRETAWRDTYGAPRGGGTRTHKGADIGAPRGHPLVAATDGTIRTGYNSTAGHYVYLTDRAGNYRFFYAHLPKGGTYVQSGQTVRAGQQIGIVGASGNAEGPHLHFGVYDLRRNGYINPTSWLQGARSGGSVSAQPPTYMPASPDANREGMDTMMTQYFSDFADFAAGGTRIDPRTLGLFDDDPELTNELTGGMPSPTISPTEDEAVPIGRDVDPADLTGQETLI